MLLARVALAKVEIAEQHPPAAISSLRTLMQQAEDQGLKYLAVESSISMAEGMLQLKQYGTARQQLDRALVRSEKLGLQPLTAKAHYLLATVAQQGGDTAGAEDHYRNVIRILESFRKDVGADQVLQRSDFAAMYAQATRAVRTGAT
jgi:tetratricopeptide (TPR) repeat protein